MYKNIKWFYSLLVYKLNSRVSKNELNKKHQEQREMTNIQVFFDNWCNVLDRIKLNSNRKHLYEREGLYTMQCAVKYMDSHSHALLGTKTFFSSSGVSLFSTH